MGDREITMVRWEVRCGRETIIREQGFEREEAASEFTDQLKAAFELLKLDWDNRIVTKGLDIKR